MGRAIVMIYGVLLLVACGGASPRTGASDKNTGADSAKNTGADSAENTFQTRKSSTAGSAHGVAPSKIKATKTEAAMKFFVVDKLKNEPITGIVVSLQGKDGRKYYTEETDELGYGEVLVPVGASYDLVYLSLGRKDITAKVDVDNEPFQNLKLTLRYKPREVPANEVYASAVGATDDAAPEQGQTFRLDGVVFDTGSTKILPESAARLDSVVEYMTYIKDARIQVSGHTDNVGRAKVNKALSHKRAVAVRSYLIDKGIDGGRVQAIGYGDEKPIASNDSDEGRQMNRRIEVREIIDEQ